MPDCRTSLPVQDIASKLFQRTFLYSEIFVRVMRIFRIDIYTYIAVFVGRMGKVNVIRTAKYFYKMHMLLTVNIC